MINWNRRRYSQNDFTEAIRNSRSYAEVARKLGLTIYGSTYETIKRTVKELELDTSHMTGQGWNTGSDYRPPRPAIPLSKILVENSTYTNSHLLKNRLIKEGIKERRCELCKGTSWMGKEIPIQLDHISGVKTDNRIENLRILCPNCHAQTDTWCSKNRRT